MVELQVKAAMENARSTSTNWLLNEKAQLRAQSDREWFAFVIIPREIRAVPRTFVAPRDHVVAGTWIFHQHWATDPAVPAGRRNAPRSQARMSVEAWERYEDQWALLNRSVAVAPVLLPERARDLALDPRVGCHRTTRGLIGSQSGPEASGRAAVDHSACKPDRVPADLGSARTAPNRSEQRQLSHRL